MQTSRAQSLPTMNTLLRWSIENAGIGEDAPQQQPGQPGWTNRSRPNVGPQRFDTGVIDAILGKPDSEVMKESLAVASDTSVDEGNRLQALDNFEMASTLFLNVHSHRSSDSLVSTS